MKQILPVFLTFVLITSCEEQDSFVETRMKTAAKFVDCLADNTPDKILNYTYPDVDHNISDKESRNFHVNKASKFIKKFGLPPKDKWIIKYAPQNNFERLLVKIPLFRGYDSVSNLLQVDVLIVFPPPQISDRICRYEIEDKYDVKRVKSLLAP